MSDIELQKFFNFDQEDLVANRACKLSSKQEKRIKAAELVGTNFFVGTGVVSILVIIGITYGVISTAIKHGVSFSRASPNDITGIIAEIGIPAIVLGFFAWNSFRLSANKVDISVQQVRGKISFVKVETMLLEKKPNGSRSYRIVEEYQLRVRKVIFENLDMKIFNFLEEHDVYIFYYIKGTKDILSAEFIAKGK